MKSSISSGSAARVRPGAGACLAVLMLLMAQGALADIGRVSFAVGEVRIERDDGTVVPARTGTALLTGDTIHSERGRAQLRFTDGGHVSLIQNTSYRIDSYEFEGQADGGESALFSLLRGGLRAITGLVGSVNKERYRLRTPLATIGIRGTTFSARLCAADCTVPDGLYVKGGEGIVFVQNVAGSIDVGRGQSAFVAGANTMPQPTARDPEVLAAGRAEDGRAAAQDRAPGDASSDEFDFTQTAFREDLDVLDETFDFGQLLLLQAGSNVARFINPRGGGFAFAASQTTTSFGTDRGGTTSDAGPLLSTQSVTLGLDANDGIVLIGASNSDVLASDLADLVDTSSASGGTITLLLTIDSVANAQSDGQLYWGRWTSGTANGLLVDSAGPFAQERVTLDAATNVHYIIGDTVATIPGAGVATYQFIGGTPSTSGSTIGAGVTGGTLQVDFGIRSLTVNNMQVQHGGMFNINGAGVVSTRGILSGVVQANGAIPVDIDGFLSGSGAVPPHAGLAYEINQPGTPILGVAGFRCATGC